MKLPALVGLLIAVTAPAAAPAELSLPAEVERAERRRIETVRRITPATIAIFEASGDNGGSGVLISPDGYALTNFHVVAPCGPTMTCGLPDGSLVDAVLVGLDPTGDIALIRLRGERRFPHAEIGDSDAVAIGDEVFVAGNPFLLADDLQPTVTHGVISGTHRYQYPSGTVLEYADCLQTDAAINPGNSGGPLYDSAGRLIGVNGRASFEKRGRVNVGVGYAVSINQVKRFIGQLKTGRIVDHGALGATGRTTSGRRVVIDAVDERSDAFRRGLRYGDEVLDFDGLRVTSANALLNAVATRPSGWSVPLTVCRGEATRTAWVRLEPRHRSGELEQIVRRQMAQPGQQDGEPDQGEAAVGIDEYERRPGYANYFYNRTLTEKLLDTCPQRLSGPTDAWRVVAVDAAGERSEFVIDDERVSLVSPRGRFWIDAKRPPVRAVGAAWIGRVAVALRLWRRVLAPSNSLGGLTAHGPTPWGPKGELADRVDAVVDGVAAEYYFDRRSGDLIGVEAWLDDDRDPCRLVFRDFRSDLGLGARQPARWTVAHGDETFAAYELLEWTATRDPDERGPTAP